MNLAKALYALATLTSTQEPDVRTQLALFNLNMNIDRALKELGYFRFYIVHVSIQMVLSRGPEATRLRMQYAECIYRATGHSPMFQHRLKGYEKRIKAGDGWGIFDQFSLNCIGRVDPDLVDFAMSVTDDLVGKTEALIRVVGKTCKM